MRSSLAVAAAILAASAPGASAQWSEPTAPTPGPGPGLATAAFGEDGVPVAAWEEPGAVGVRRGNASRRYPVPGGTFGTPRVAATGAGIAVAAWRETNRVVAVTTRRDGSFGDPEPVASVRSRERFVVAAGGGRFVVVWLDNPGGATRVYAASRSAAAGSAWSAPVLVAGRGGSIDVDVDDRGRATILWHRRGSGLRILARTLDRQRLGRVQTLARTTDTRVRSASLDVAPGGTAVVAHAGYNADGRLRVRVRRGRFGPFDRPVTAPGRPIGVGDAAVTDAGRWAVAYEVGATGAVRLARGRPGTRVTSVAVGTREGSPRLAIAPDGSAEVAYAGLPDFSVQVRRWPLRGGLTAAEVVAPAAGDTFREVLALARTAGGGARLAFQQSPRSGRDEQRPLLFSSRAP